MAVAIVAGALANKPNSGGEAWVRLSWVLGLRRLGFDVWFVECLPGSQADGRRYFERVVTEFGLKERAALFRAGGEPLFGPGEAELAERLGGAEVLFDISGHLGGGSISAAAKTRAYVDLDPGFTQAWHADPGIEFSIAGYDHYLTVGQNLGRPSCPVPIAGIEWMPTLPPVLLGEWEPAPPPERMRFTTVATWRSPYGAIEIGGRTMSLKHQQFRRFAELPRLVPDADFELALAIHPGDAADLELLRENGWQIVDPVAAAGTPADFRDYIRGSAAEFSVAQGVYVEAATGWFSDRTAAYLASGRPAVVQDTGLEALFPTGGGEKRLGLVAFEDVEGAVGAVEATAAGWGERSRAARAFAEEHLDSDRVLGRLLEIVLPLLILLALPFFVAASPAGAASIEVTGRPQTVFDWSRQACAAVESPDLPVRAFRDSRDRVQVLLSHYVNYRLVGPSLDRLHPDCDPVMGSRENAHPGSFSDLEWIGSLFTRDGRTIWALVHDEYQGNRHPRRCPSGSYYRCWYNAVTLARSSDGGRSYRPVRGPPQQLIAGPSFRYRPDLGSRGVFGPSNIVVGPDRALYALVRIRDLAGRRGVCVIRSRRISSPRSWRAWDGSGFGARFRDPYRSPGRRRASCRLVDPGQIAEMTESLTYSRTLRRYLLVGMAPPGPLSVGANVRGVYFSTSTDLIHWEPRRLLVPAVTKKNYRCGGRAPIAYPSLIDPGSRSRTYATSGAKPYLYYTRFRYRGCRQTRDRDLMRVRLEVAP